MTQRRSPRRAFVAALALSAAVAVSACGSDDKDSASTTATTAASAVDLAPVKQYLLDHTERLQDNTAALQRDAEAYYALAKQADFDYAALLADRRAEVQRLVKQLQQDFHAANPSYRITKEEDSDADHAYRHEPLPGAESATAPPNPPWLPTESLRPQPSSRAARLPPPALHHLSLSYV
jgi:hypothetical protein